MISTTCSIKRHLVAGAIVFGAVFAGGTASAALISCPNPVTGTQDRVYETTGASDCVWGNGNIGQGQPLNDAFLLNQGTNDATYGDSGKQFGKTWTTIDSVNYVASGWGLSGLTISSYDGDYFEWALTNNAFGSYALGLKDGGEPKWAVFLLSDTSGVAQITSQGGDWSHVVLYGSGTPSSGDDDDDDDEQVPGVPEPATVALIGLGLFGLAASRRRSRKR